MSSARGDILGAVRDALAGATEFAGRATAEAVGQRLRDHRVNLIPARGRLGAKARIDLFIREAEQVNATVARISGASGIPGEVARYLAKNNLPMALKVAPAASEPIIPWTRQTLLTVEAGLADGSESVGVSRAFAGVAETGTLVLLSDPANPTRLNFLPPTHVVVVSAAEIVGDYEEAWARIRTERMDAAGRFMPPTVNWITGPSRTADIEQTLLLGAHGPQRLHIVIADEEIPTP
ncbi:MAG: lactate utilization protein C [Rhodospirillales bacterium]